MGSNRTDVDQWDGKFDWVPTSNDRLTLGLSYRDSESIAPNYYGNISQSGGLSGLRGDGMPAKGGSPDVRRKTRVMVWGTLIGFLPAFLIVVVGQIVNKGLEDSPFWLWTGAVVATMLMPVSYAYAVVKDRVLEIPVLLKKSARYLIVQRGFVLVTVLISIMAILLFIALFTRFFRAHAEIAVPASLGVGTLFGIAAVVANLQIVPRVTKRIDRAFFRNAYDAQEVLEHLAHKSRTAAGRETLAEMLECEISQALHPAAIAIYLQNGACELTFQRSNGQGEALALPDGRLLEELVGRAEPIDVHRREIVSNEQIAVLDDTQPECLVPILNGQGRLTGVIALVQDGSDEHSPPNYQS